MKSSSDPESDPVRGRSGELAFAGTRAAGRAFGRFLLLCALGGLLSLPGAHAQLGGSRAGVEPGTTGVPEMPGLDRLVVESHITVEGRAEIRVAPTEIRIVLAVTGEGETAQACRGTVGGTIERLKAAWADSGLDPEEIDVVEDFIAVLPRYEWQLERQGDLDVGVERKVGYRLQTNLHVKVPDDARAQRVLNTAFEQGITDIIGFDYGSRELADAKARARKQALEAASRKAEMLFASLFPTRPPAINVQEETTVRHPESLYHSFANSYEEQVTGPWRRDVPLIRAARPRNTYYRGLSLDSDVQPGELPMKPEISVISTVRVYYRSPAAECPAAE